MALTDQNQDQKLSELHKQEAEELAQILSQKYKIPYIDLSTISTSTEALRLIPEAKAREANVVAFRLIGKKAHIAGLSPETVETKKALEEIKEKGYSVELYICSETSLEIAWGRYKEISYSVETRAGLIDISQENMEAFMEKFKDISSLKAYIKELTDNSQDRGVSLLLEVVLAGAIKTKSSDIHIEPQDDAVRIRYRIDGVLQDMGFMSHKTYKLIDSRIKLISNLKLNTLKTAQDGRFTVGINNKELEIRTSVLPGSYGESVVLRILDPDSIKIPLEEMGIEKYLLEIFFREIKKPNGMILVTGPTGSGKTTTLYAFMSRINKPETKIITIEDPVEYHLTGVAQTQINEEGGYTFLEGLRAALRQDPDIIMLGEIRDEETANVAMNSSLTGHLVFSTLHTNNAAGAIPRLIDLKVNPKIIGSALNIAIAQRLVRKLCPFCRKERQLSEREQEIVSKTVSSINQKRADIKLANTSLVWDPVGCEECNGLGYKGRIGIFEAILMGEEIGKVITENSNEEDIKKASQKQGILDMKEDGIIKVLDGTTSMKELERVIELEKTDEFVPEKQS